MYKIYGKEGCDYCKKAKALAIEEGLDYEYIDLDVNPQHKIKLRSDGFTSIPAIYQDGVIVGGHDELVIHLSK